jgi:hypothetical protein
MTLNLRSSLIKIFFTPKTKLLKIGYPIKHRGPMATTTMGYFLRPKHILLGAVLAKYVQLQIFIK